MPNTKNRERNGYIIFIAVHLFPIYVVYPHPWYYLSAHMKWMNRRYEVSRWLIIGAMVRDWPYNFSCRCFPGFRAQDAAVGSCFQHSGLSLLASLISIGIYNIEATHANRRKMNIVCASIYAAAILAALASALSNGNFHIGSWIYVMIVLFGINVTYCIYMIIVEIRKRRRMLRWWLVMCIKLGVSPSPQSRHLFVGMRHHCWGMRQSCFKEKHYLCTMKV